MRRPALELGHRARREGARKEYELSQLLWLPNTTNLYCKSQRQQVTGLTAPGSLLKHDSLRPAGASRGSSSPSSFPSTRINARGAQRTFLAALAALALRLVLLALLLALLAIFPFATLLVLLSYSLESLLTSLEKH